MKIKAIERQKKESQRIKKVSKQLYYTTQSLMGIHGVYWYWLCGSRGRGKSYGVDETLLQYIKRYGQENVKCYYFRISDLSIKAMLANNAAKCIDAMLVRKYHLNLSVHDTTLYNDDKPMIYFYPLVSAAKKGKGVAEYDPEFLMNPETMQKKNRFIFIIIDEFMMADGLEKKSIGDPVSQFQIYLENILRDQEQLDWNPVKIFGCANSVSECNDFLSRLVGFVPEEPGRFILKRKHAVVDNIPNSEAYLEKRKKSIGADVMDYENDANYTNVIKRDLETLKPKNVRLHTVTNVIKFSKDPKDWFTVWNGNIIKRYSNQPIKESQVICMKRHLDGFFSVDLVNDIIERYDVRAFLYNDLISQSNFAAQLKILRSK